MKNFQNNVEDEKLESALESLMNYLESEDLEIERSDLYSTIDSLMNFLEKHDQAEELDSSVNISLNGSPVYPRIYTGDSARPLMGQYPESEYKDDNNIHQTWLGLMSFYG